MSTGCFDEGTFIITVEFGVYEGRSSQGLQGHIIASPVGLHIVGSQIISEHDKPEILDPSSIAASESSRVGVVGHRDLVWRSPSCESVNPLATQITCFLGKAGGEGGRAL